MLQLNELVADSGKTKIKTGQVQAASRSWEPGFQSELSTREGEQGRGGEGKPFLCMQRTFPELKSLILTDF